MNNNLVFFWVISQSGNLRDCEKGKSDVQIETAGKFLEMIRCRELMLQRMWEDGREACGIFEKKLVYFYQ